MRTAEHLVMLTKHAINGLVSPIWCHKCGCRLSERPTGFGEQGSDYTCQNSTCVAFALPFVVPSRRNAMPDVSGAASAVTGMLSEVR